MCRKKSIFFQYKFACSFLLTLYFLIDKYNQNFVYGFLVEYHYRFSSHKFPNCISYYNPLIVNRADSRMRSHFFHFDRHRKPQVDLQHSTAYSDAISIFGKQWKPSARPLSTISIRIYPVKGQMLEEQEETENGGGALVAKATGGIRENPYPSYPCTCTVSITNPVARIT